MSDPIIGPEVVIRDDSGHEHVFPPGFDPKRAAQIVRSKTYTPPNLRRDARGVPISESDPAEDRPVASYIGRLVSSIRNPTPGVQLGMDLFPLATGALFGKPGGGPLPEALPPAGAVGAGVKAAALELPGIKQTIKGPLQAGLKAYREAATPAAQNPAGAPRLVPKGTGAPPIEETLQEAVSAARQPPPAQTSGNPPPGRTFTPAGKPSTTAAEYDAGTAAKAAQPNVGRVTGEVKPGSAPAPKRAAGGTSSQEALPTTRKSAGTKNAKIADSAEGADALDQLQQAITGQAEPPTAGNGTGPKLTPEEVTRLRRTYGADRLGRAAAPSTPEAAVGQMLKDAPGPSAMPDIAQKAVLDSLRNPGQIKDMGKFLRAINQLAKEYKRNNGVANSDIAREVAAALKKYGYDVPRD